MSSSLKQRQNIVSLSIDDSLSDGGADDGDRVVEKGGSGGGGSGGEAASKSKSAGRFLFRPASHPVLTSSTSSCWSPVRVVIALVAITLPLALMYFVRNTENVSMVVGMFGLGAGQLLSSPTTDRLLVVQWNGAAVWAGFGVRPVWPEPNYVGHDVHRVDDDDAGGCQFVAVHSFESTAASDQDTASAVGRALESADDASPLRAKALLAAEQALQADAVILEWMPAVAGRPVRDHLDYARNPPRFPERLARQQWVNFGFETKDYFPILGDPLYVAQFQVNSTQQRGPSQVPLTYACAWGGDAAFMAEQAAAAAAAGLDPVDQVARESDQSAGRRNQLPRDWRAMAEVYRSVPPSAMDSAVWDQTKVAAFMASNCVWGGADRRTEYVRQLMDHLPVHSFGKCLHNKELPEAAQRPIYDDHGLSMRVKTEVFRGYRFVLAFENGPDEDYVSEKVFNALLAGSLPVYMGTDRVDEFLPSPDSIVKVSDFPSPKHLAEYLHTLMTDDKAYAAYFQWKQRPLPDQFLAQFGRCLFYGADTRLCNHVRRKSGGGGGSRTTGPPHQRTHHGQGVNVGRSMDFGARAVAAQAYARSTFPVAAATPDSFTLCFWVFPRRLGNENADHTSVVAVQGLSVILWRSTADAAASNGAADGDSGVRVLVCSQSTVDSSSDPSCVLVSKQIAVHDWTHITVKWSSWVPDARGPSAAAVTEILLDAFPAQLDTSFSTSGRSFHPLPVEPVDWGVIHFGHLFDGRLDDVLLWDRPLPVHTVRPLLFQRISTAELTGPDGLIAQWRFDSAGENQAPAYLDFVAVNDQQQQQETNPTFPLAPVKPLRCTIIDEKEKKEKDDNIDLLT